MTRYYNNLSVGLSKDQTMPHELEELMGLHGGCGLPDEKYYDYEWRRVRSPLEAALFYALDLGWPVFPCELKLKDKGGYGKPPLTPNGFKDATTDPARIEAWWKEHPDALIGHVPGSVGHVVVDLDVKGESNGIEALVAEARKNNKRAGIGRQDLDTVIVDTISGGQHLYFRVEGRHFGNSVGGWQGAGIDIRGDDGYVILPAKPSAAEGYRWYSPAYTPWRFYPKPLPGWFIERLEKKADPGRPKKTRAAFTDAADADAEDAFYSLVAEVKGLPEGSRNNELNNAAFRLGRFVGAGRLDVQRVRAALQEAVAGWSDPKKTLDTIENGLRDGQLQPCDPRNVAGQSEKPWQMALKCAADVVPVPISWLWKYWLARGKLHIIAGQMEAGKTTIALRMAATVSSGGRWPDGTPAPEGNVIIWSGEDTIEDTLVPRLKAAGANLHRVFFADHLTREADKRPFDPSTDMPILEAAITECGGAALIIIDPIVSATSGDSHKNSETRRGLQPVVDLAARLNAAIIGITHFTKGTQGKDPKERVTGSLAFGAMARLVMVAAQKPEGDDGAPGERVLMRAKSNNGPSRGGFVYDLQVRPLHDHPDIIAPVAVWGAAVEGTAHDALNEAEGVVDKRKGGGKLEAALAFLHETLSGGPKSASDCQAAADREGIAAETLKNAKQQLGVISQKSRGVGGGWVWVLPGVQGEFAM